MSHALAPELSDTGAAVPTALPLPGQYALTAALVAAATLAAFLVEQLIAAPNLTLIFVLPVVIAGAAFGWGPSLAAAVAGVLAFDFFFVEPRFNFRIDSASDIWAAVLLLVIGGIVSAVAAQSRARAVEARRAADQAQALQHLAHLVIEGRHRDDIVHAAATALNRIFEAPAVVFEGHGGEVSPSAIAGDIRLTIADIEAARGVLEARLSSRARTYPYDQSSLDLWPLVTPDGARAVMGVRFDEARPNAPERLVEVVGGYLAAAFARG